MQHLISEHPEMTAKYLEEAQEDVPRDAFIFMFAALRLDLGCLVFLEALFLEQVDLPPHGERMWYCR